MSSEKRRRARVQGSWAAPPRKTPVKKDRPTDEAAESMSNLEITSPVRKEKPEHQQFQYVESGQALRVAPPLIRIENETEEAILSTEPTGTSSVRYYPNFLDVDKRELERMFQQLYNELPWKQRNDSRNGVTYQQPRLTAWFGDLPYAYSGVILQPNKDWNALVVDIRRHIEMKTKHTFNSVLANLYRNEHDSVDWHSDDEPGLGHLPVIASVSFGDVRIFEMRKNPPPEEDGDHTYQQQIKIPLPAGSLLFMEGATQADWQHRIPKEYHSRGARINLTFRTIFPV